MISWRVSASTLVRLVQFNFLPVHDVDAPRSNQIVIRDRVYYAKHLGTGAQTRRRLNCALIAHHFVFPTGVQELIIK